MASAKNVFRIKDSGLTTFLVYQSVSRAMGDFGKNITSIHPCCNKICEFDVDVEKEQHSITNSGKYYDLPEQISRNIIRKTHPQMIFEFVKQHFRSE